MNFVRVHYYNDKRPNFKLNSRMGRWMHYPAFKHVKVWTLSFQMNYQPCSNLFCSQI